MAEDNALELIEQLDRALKDMADRVNAALGPGWVLEGVEFGGGICIKVRAEGGNAWRKEFRAGPAFDGRGYGCQTASKT